MKRNLSFFVALAGLAGAGCDAQLDVGSTDSVDRALSCEAAAEVAGPPMALGPPERPDAPAMASMSFRPTWMPVAPDPNRQRMANGAPAVIYLNRDGATL